MPPSYPSHIVLFQKNSIKNGNIIPSHCIIFQNGEKKEAKNKSVGAVGLSLSSLHVLSVVPSLAGPRGLTAYPLSDSPIWQKAALLP